ncbi:DUF2755 family protein [Erwinia sp. CPCC 100877]|nr:DUF2755 family protein [Erwinia sp. CPCC 100877]
MADFTLSKPAVIGTKGKGSPLGNVAYALFVLFIFWVGSLLIDMLIQAPGVFERLMQNSDTTRPHIEMGLGVGSLFGIGVFALGALIMGISATVLHLRRRHLRR